MRESAYAADMFEGAFDVNAGLTHRYRLMLVRHYAVYLAVPIMLRWLSARR